MNPNDRWSDAASLETAGMLNAVSYCVSTMPEMNYWPATIQPHAQSPTMQAGEAGGAQPAHCMPEAHAPATHGMLAMTQPRVQCPTMQAGEAGGAQPAHCMPEAHAPATHGMLAMMQPRVQCPTMQAGEAGRAQPAHCMPEAHAPATHGMLAMTQPRVQCPTMQAGEAGGAQPAHCMPEAHAPATHGMLAMTQPRAQCPTMQAGEAGGAQPAHCMPEAHAPATHGMLAMTQPRVQCPTMQAGEAGGAQPAHCMPEAHAPATHGMLAMMQPRVQCPTMQAGEADGAQPAHCMPEAHAPATHGMLAMTQPRVQYPTMQAREARGAHHVPAEHAPAIHAGTMPPYEAQPAKEQTGMLHSCMLMDTSRDVGKSSVIVHHYNTTLQRHTIYRITILDKQRRPTNVIPMDYLKTAIQWLGILSTSYCAVAITYIAWLLLACGDVEANPGPNTHYVQQVGSSTCQANSLNNIAGRKWVSIDDIDTFYAQRLTQLNTPDELKAWQMARGAGGYDDGVIDLYLTSKYGLMATSVADLRRPQDWTKHNLNSLAQRHETTAFLCKRLGHSMAMTSLNGKWSLKDSLDPAPTPLARIAMSTKQTHHQLFIITPTHTTRTSAQLALCHTKKINHIISHTNHNTGLPVPIYMEAQHKCFCLVHAINMAMGRPMINPNDVLTHCNHLATHLQDLASRARGENKHIPLPDRTPHIYDEEGNFNIHSMNHYLYHNYKTLHLATQELPHDNITRATLSTLMGNEDNHISNAAILINRNHATTLRYLDNTWYWLDSQATHARRLLTTADWKELQGGLILIKQGMQHKNLIEPIFWLADPLEQATTTQLEQHYQRPDPIDLSGHDDQPPAIPPPAATPPSLATSNNDLKRKNTSAEADPPTRSRHREAATTKEDAATPPPPTRNEKPSTKTGPKKPRSKKGARNTSHSKEGLTQTLMSRYLTTTQATTSSPSVPCPTTEAPPNIPTQAHQTPSRQHLTLTTLNVRGLYRARRDVAHLIHHHHPDILILTETKTQHKKDTPGWLRVATQDYTLHRHGGHSEVLIGIKHDLAIPTQATLAPPSTEAEVNSRCVILTLSQHHSDNLTIVATYWPSGCNEDALPLREKMQQHIRTATRHLPGSLILAGDLNATMKTEDRSEHTEYTQDRMMREFATEMRLPEADPGDRAWTYQQPHCNSRIDAILTRDARPGPEHRTNVDTRTYLSDHRPLTATLTTARLGIHLAQTQQPQNQKHTVLTTPINNSDREAFRLAVQQPSSGAPQLHAQLAAYLSPLFTEATAFLANLDKANPHQPKRLTQLAGLHPRQAVDMAATMLTTLLKTCRTTAMKTCTTKTLTRGGQHYQRRTMCRIRLALGKKLKTTRNLSRQARQLFKQNGAHPTIEELIPDTDTSNTAIREAVLARQDDDPTDNHVQAALAKLTNTYRDQIHQLDDDDSALAIAQARLRMQQLISTQPKKANKYILRPSRTSHKGLQALTDPATRRICTAPADLNRIIIAAYGQKLSPPTPKTGHYTDTQTRNYPWARAKADDPFTLHTCKSIHWMHTAIMDKASFQECLSRLAGGKAPGPDGIENEIIKMLPWEMRDTIHQLFIIMWATGCTPTAWKTSDTCLLYKDKGQETDLNAYRPVGLANTIYKLWTSLITKTLYEYAEANGMLSKCQAGFRSHRDTTQQLQMLVMALEDAKLAKADIYALMVDFTSAFNTTCQDKLLWIMHDLGFPTDATDAVKDLYTGATTRFKTPYGPTDPIPVDRGTIQGDSLSPFLFLIYIEPLLRWLQVGARGYKFQSVENDSDNRYTIGSIDYADDVAILCNSISNTRVQADKLSAYSDWGHLIISHSKTLATAALHKAHQSGRCSTQEDAEKEARKQLQDLRLQGKPLRQKLDRLRRSFASARQAIHIIKTAIIPSLAYSFCVVPCTPGDLDLFDRAVNQCVKHKLNLPLGTPNAVIRDDIDKLGLGISSAAQEYHARNTTALVSSLQSADNTYAHISRCMLHKQITWLYAQAAKHGHRIPNLLQHTLRARQLLHTTTANLFATHEGAPLYPKETKALGQLITQSASPLPRDIVSACITCLKSLGLTHPSELICQDNIHIMSGDSLRKRFGTKVKQKHIIALNRLTAMATMEHCPTATEAKTILGRRDTTLTLPADQRRIRAWAAGLTELTPHTTAHTGPRYTDIRAYMTTKTPAKDTQPPTPTPITATARSKLTNNAPKPPTAKQPTPQPRIGSKRPAEDRHTEADDRHTQTIPDVVTHIPIMTLANLSTWKADTARQHKNEQLGIMLGAMYDHQESITAIDGWHWNGNNQESYYNVHWRPTIIEKWALQMYKKEGYTPAHTEDICRADAEHACTCELCWEPKETAPFCAHGEDDLKTAMRKSVETDLIKAHWHPTTEPKPLILAHIDYTDKKNEYDADNNINDTAYGAHHNCLLVRHTGLSTWNVPAEDALALKCIKHAIHSATMEEATATILLIPGKKGISYPKHIAMLKSYPEYCQHLATIPLDKSKAATKSCKHATLLTYIVWNKAGQQLVTKGNLQGWLANTATALHPRPDRHPKHNQPSKHVQPTQLPSGHYKHMHLPADRELPATGHMRQPNQIAPPFCTTSSMVIPNWRTVTYTDGSCMQETDRAPSRKVGAGVYTPENDERLTIALPDHSTINRAELAAIHAAIKSGATHIATDSLCSIYQIRRALANPMSLRTHHHRDILADIATLIMNSRDTIHLRKVRAHSGIIGNEAADTLAKHAAMYPEQAHTQAPHEHTEQQTWLSATTETGTTIPLPDCRHSVRTHMRAKHKLGLANQDSIYYQMSQDIARVAAKGSCERVMLDPGIPTAAQRTALLYRTGGLYNQKLAMRWGKAADDRTGARETAPGADAAARAMCGLTTEVKDAMHTLTQLLDEHVKRKSTRTRLLHMFFNGKPVMRRRAALKLANPTITKWLMHKTTQAKQLVRAYVQAVELDIAANQDSSMEDMPDAAQQPPPAPASAAPAATSAAPQAPPAQPASAAQQPAAAAAATRLTQLRPAAVVVPPNTTTHDRINHLERENRSLKQNAQVDALQQQLIAVQARLADKEAACLKLQQQVNNYKAKALPVIAKENLAKVTVSISRLEAERAAAQASAAQLLAAWSSLMEVSAALDRINTDLAKQRQTKLHYEKSPDFDAATQYVFEQAQVQAKEPLAAEQAARQAAEEQLGNTQQQLHEAQVFIEHLQRHVADERQQRERAQNDLAQLRADEKAASQRLQQLRRQISVHKATIASDKTGLLAIVTNNYDHLRVTERITPDRVHDPAFQERVAMCLVDEQLLGPVPRNTPPGQFAQQHEDMAIDPDDMSCPDPVQAAAPGVGSADVAQQAGTSRPRPPKPTFEPLPPPSSIMPEEYRVVPEERERYFTKHFAPQLHAMRKDYDLSITRFNADEAWNHKAMGFGADYRQWQSLMCHYATKASDPPQSKEQSHKPHMVKTGLPARFSGASGQFAEDAIFLFLDYLTGNNIPQPDWPSHILPLLEGKALQAWLSVAQPL
ncbi:hypothetical protein QJQ45_022599 [Haematococcus lacustris]|nr:hypothetical protein QJQ45_022599 [Haematococcus lacustris]